jgi:hypothetical protein
MLIERKAIEIRNEDGSLNENESYFEGYFDSSNIIKTIYIPTMNYLYIIFKNGLVYSYVNITKELYGTFEKAESQGKFFRSEMRTNPQYKYFREFKLKEFERMDILNLIEEMKNLQNEDK